MDYRQRAEGLFACATEYPSYTLRELDLLLWHIDLDWAYATGQMRNESSSLRDDVKIMILLIEEFLTTLKG